MLVKALFTFKNPKKFDRPILRRTSERARVE